MKKSFSIDTLVKIIKQCTKRFPIPVGFIIMLTTFLLWIAWAEESFFPDRVRFSVIYYLGVGILLSVVLQLWGEEVKEKRNRLLANAVTHISLLTDSIYIYANYPNAGWETFMGHASLITALTLCLFVLPFFREKDDMASWNFTLRLFSSAIQSWLIGGIMCAGICLLTAAVEQLFGISLSEKWYSTWCILFLQTLPMLLFIGQMPEGKAKCDRTPRVSTFLNKSIHYLFLPLLGCYLIVLYGYLAKIVFQWQLPDGWVSALVSVLSFGFIAIVLGLYPSLRQGASKIDNRMVRILPLAILPLLALMTVGIIRRFDDYGITVKRLYLLALNIWFYIVCIGMYICKARRVSWIAASFAAFFVLISVLPVNIISFTRNHIYEQVTIYIKDNYKGKLPMDAAAYYKWISKLPADEARLLNSRLEYLYDVLDDKRKSSVISNSIYWYKAYEYIKDTTEKGNELHCYNSTMDTEMIKLDRQYSMMLAYSYQSSTISLSSDGTLHVPIYKDKKAIDTLYVNIDNIKKWHTLKNYTPQDVQCHNKNNRFVLTNFTLNGIDKGKKYDFSYSGYYLMQK